MSFNDGYIDVAIRLQVLKGFYPEASLQPWNPDKPYEIITLRDGATYIVVVAACYRFPADVRPGVGMAWQEFPGKGFTSGNELMIAETSAWGRAIVAAIQTETKKIASKQEVEASKVRAEVVVDENQMSAYQLAQIKKNHGDMETLGEVIQGLPDRVATGELEEPKTCKHGTMLIRRGTSEKTALPYFGYVCSEKTRANQCTPNWFELSPSGQWREKIPK